MKRFAPGFLPSRHRLAWGVAAVLAVLLAGTWGVRAWRTAAVQEQADEQRMEAAEDALAYAEAQFEQLQQDLLQRAETVAEAPVVVRALRQRQEGESAATGPLVRYANALEWPERYAVEIYDPLPRVLAWRGFSMPLDDAPDALRFLEAPQTAVAGSSGERQALVAWHPVREGGRTVGAARVSNVVRFQPPVQNEYLQGYSLAEKWSRATGRPLAVHYGQALPADVSPEAKTRALKSVGGRTLGYVTTEPPPEAQFVQAVRARYGDWMVLWAVLLMAVGVTALWRWFGTGLRRTGEAPPPRRLLRLAGRFAVAGAAWGALRYALLALNVPARWVEDMPALAPLFDPAQMASTVGAGALRSTGDLLISGAFAFGFAVALLRVGGRFWSRCRSLKTLRAALRAKGFVHPSPGRSLLALAATSAGVTVMVAGLAGLARRAVLDSTFDFFARTGLLPRPLVLVVFCALLLFAGAVMLASAGLVALGRWGAMRHAPRRWQRPVWIGAALAALALPLVLAYVLLGAQDAFAAWPLPLVVGAVGVALVRLGLLRHEERFELLTLRRLLPAVLFLAVVLYPMLYGGMHARRQARLSNAADAFAAGGDPRLLFSLEQVLQEADREPALRAALTNASSGRRPASFDSLGAAFLRGSLLSSLGAYDVSLTLFDSTGAPVGRYAPGPSSARSASPDAELDVLRSMYRDKGGQGTMVTEMTGWPAPERFQYAGLVPIRTAAPDSTASAAPAGTAAPAGWLVARATPQAFRPDAGTPFPRALLPEGYYADLYAEVALAEFQDGALVRNLGRDFGRVRLPGEVQQALASDSVLWRTEEGEGSAYLTLYRRQAAGGSSRSPFRASPAVMGARVPAVTTFDHLYYALRLVIAGFLVAVLLYLAGLALRRRAGLLPAPQVRFRDKVLNALLGVGAVSVIVVGLVGLRVLTGENERATQQWLRQRLEQVEEILAMEAEGGEPLYQVAERIGTERLAARVGLDLNLYEGPRLVASSRPRLVEERLIDHRLPIEAYQALYFEGERFAAAQQKIGRFPYMVGFRVLTDAQGRPRFVLSAPTLPEQERIAEEQARTVAYLFGALLLLILLVTVTALVLAGALTRPLRRIRAGLEAVGKGEFASALPTDTRDEIGELAATFNEMRDQLAESRRKLAQQERELAWREMARQVAHEIKNPLTPMKLSVQHLRRAFERADLEKPERRAVEEGGDGQEGQGGNGQPADKRGVRRFSTLFERITSTLIEQIDSLSRIANEFSSFARLPTRITEPLDLNETVEGAASLMQEEEAGAEIRLQLHPKPLVVEADSEELRRLYINLIKNALQALPEDAAGQRQGRVEVATARASSAEGDPAGPGRARSTVTDNGSGIPEELREKIFQPNFSTKTSGTGLGLAIAKKSVEELGGAIGFETEEGEGTTFWIELPLKGRGNEGKG